MPRNEDVSYQIRITIADIYQDPKDMGSKEFTDRYNQDCLKILIADRLAKEGWNKRPAVTAKHKCVVCDKDAVTNQLSNGWRCENHVLFGNVTANPLIPIVCPKQQIKEKQNEYRPTYHR